MATSILARHVLSGVSWRLLRMMSPGIVWCARMGVCLKGEYNSTAYARKVSLCEAIASTFA